MQASRFGSEGSERLDTLPLDIFLIILEYLDTAKSLASLSLTCRRLHQTILADGWRTFARSRFDNLTLPQNTSGEDWQSLTRSLTWQSRAWARRAFVLDTLMPWNFYERRSVRGSQSVPFHVIVEAHSTFDGQSEQETVFWGAGEDLIGRYRQRRNREVFSEKWLKAEGVAGGFQPGRDDITAISMLQGPDSEGHGVIVGRASGDLRLQSFDSLGSGRTLLRFSPSNLETAEQETLQNVIQSIDVTSHQDVLATSTKDDILLYPLKIPDSCSDGVFSHVQPTEVVRMRQYKESKPFKYLRSIKFMANGSLALAVTTSIQPLRYVSITPTGIRLAAAAKMRPSYRCAASHALRDWETGTARSLLPISNNCLVSGGGSALLSSYDDGTIRLQDVRTPSNIDSIYQDNFDPLTPINSLLAFGSERFIGGSARAANIKVFDFRWTKRYEHTAALPCSSDYPYPFPTPPIVAEAPDYPERSRCNHLSGEPCRWHALSKTDYYRPNVDIYLRPKPRQSFPQSVYSLAKGSDISPTIYAGLGGELMEIQLKSEEDTLRLKSGFTSRTAWAPTWPYQRLRSPGNIIETGDGFALDDIGQSQRVPPMRIQKEQTVSQVHLVQRKAHRLDDWFQWGEDYQ